MNATHLNIKDIMDEIFIRYNCTQYLQSTGESSFDNVRGTRLWELWYGIDFEGFGLSTMQHKYNLCKNYKDRPDDFYLKVKELRDSLKNEFANLTTMKARKTK